MFSIFNPKRKNKFSFHDSAHVIMVYQRIVTKAIANKMCGFPMYHQCLDALLSEHIQIRNWLCRPVASPVGGRTGGDSHVWAIWVCAAVKGMAFRQFSLEKIVEIRQLWSTIGYNLPEKWQVCK